MQFTDFIPESQLKLKNMQRRIGPVVRDWLSHSRRTFVEAQENYSVIIVLLARYGTNGEMLEMLWERFRNWATLQILLENIHTRGVTLESMFAFAQDNCNLWAENQKEQLMNRFWKHGNINTTTIHQLLILQFEKSNSYFWANRVTGKPKLREETFRWLIQQNLDYDCLTLIKEHKDCPEQIKFMIDMMG